MSQTKAQLIDNLVQALNFTSTASAPANGLFLSAANTLALATNSGQRLTIDSNGRVMIGTTTLGHSNSDELTLNNSGNCGITIRSGSSSDGNIFFADADSDTIGTLKYDHANNAFRINTNGSERMRIDSSGRVGIGTTSPTGDLEVFGSLGLIIGNASGSGKLFADGGSTKVGSKTNHRLDFITNDTHRASIDTSGRVGIGTTSPSDTLTISGGNGSALAFIGGTNDVQYIKFGDSGDDDIGNIFYYHGNNNMVFTTNASEAMRIDSSGNVGIGTSSPTFSSGNGLQLADNFFLGFGTGNGTRPDFQFGTTAGSTLDIRCGTGADTVDIVINTSGFLGLGTTSPSRKLHVDSSFIRVSDGYGLDTGGSSERVTLDDGFVSLTTNSTERFRIDSSGRVLIGTTSTDDYDGFNSSLQVTGATGDKSSVTISRFSNNGSGANLVLAKSRTGTIGNNAVLQAGDNIGNIQFHGNDGSGFHDAAMIKVIVASGVGDNDMPADLIFSVNGGTTGVTERMRIDSAGNVGIGTSSPININSYAGLTLADSNGGIISFLDSGVERGRTGLVGELTYVVQVGPGSSSITFDRLTHDGSNNVNGATELGRFNPNGHFLVGTTSDTIGTSAATEGVAIRKEGHVVSRGTSSSGAKFTAKTTDTGGSQAFRVMLAQTEIGSITMGAGGTAFNTTSDYRRKENVVDLTGAITRLKTLLPKRFNFIGDSGVTRDGFLAHEVTAVPEAIYGTKDQVDSDNNPVYQQIDQSKLVPLLVAALQEEITKREALETRVAALEAA